MTIKLGIILLGSLLIYAGWKNLDIQSLLFGDNTVPKKPASWSNPTSPSGSSGSAGAGSASTPAPAASPQTQRNVAAG